MKNILLVGDSIREGYDKYVKMAFDGVANVYYPNENCRFSTYVLRHLCDWKDAFTNGVKIDLIHWNAGLWDALIMQDGMPLIDIEEYKKNIERICKMIKILFPRAEMIFATSTPVQENLFTGFKRFNKMTESYNAAAVKIVMSHGGKINDLYELMKNQPIEYHSDRTHYYTKEGTRVITNKVIGYIEEALGISASPLDYDLLFKEKSAFVGL